MGPREGWGQDQVKEKRVTSPHLEVWAGVEATTVRVGDNYFHQLDQSGHATRLDDLDRFASLGIKAIRYPVLWERTAPDGPESADWSWADERLGRLRELGVRPIVGLVHHGSGPAHTSLLDPAFPEKVAQYARAVAERYPWVEEYTPINEPLTTARFSALYGHWYPHRRDDQAFAQALLIQCRAVVLAMRAIREVNPDARLVQTDDLGKTFSTPTLAYQADLENERRWISWDLLTGRLTPDHLMWGWLRRCAGVEDAELAWFHENPCPPDIVGINTYLSSERFLDERVDRYPTEIPGTNGRHTYVDVLAARVLPEGASGPEALLCETWERYGLPIAVTEAHNGCTREEQLRWLDEMWRGAHGACAAGADVRAVTAWSLLGAFDWNTLLTRQDNFYEPGVFDLRAPEPRPTAIATMLWDLAQHGEHRHPVLAGPGWWRRPDRFIYPLVTEPDPGTANGQDLPLGWSAPPLLIVGAGTPLGEALAHICRDRGLAYRLLAPEEMGTGTAESMGAVLNHYEPWGVIDAGAYLDAGARSGSKGRDPGAVLAEVCASRRVALLAIGSDLVFAGNHGQAYLETDDACPAGILGETQAAREQRVLDGHPGALVIRTGPVFGPWDRDHPVAAALWSLEGGTRCFVPDDVVVSPTYLPDLIHVALDLLIDGERGIWHVVNSGAASWAEVARAAAAESGLPTALVVGRRTDDAPEPSQRLARVLASGRGQLLPSWEDALRRYLQERDLAMAEPAGSLGRVACPDGVRVDGEDVVLGAAAS